MIVREQYQPGVDFFSFPSIATSESQSIIALTMSIVGGGFTLRMLRRCNANATGNNKQLIDIAIGIMKTCVVSLYQ